jgi:thioredoxin reductase (NADPH)
VALSGVGNGQSFKKEFNVVIAGGGIAGMTAAITSARLGRRTLALTGDVLGGQLLSIDKVEGFPGFPDGIAGYDLCPMMQEQAVASGAEIMMNSLQGLQLQHAEWRVTTDAGDIAVRGIIIATGSRLKKLDVPGEEHLTGKGVSASCDAPLLRNRVVAVVGGGDSAMQEALTLAAFASKVIMMQRGGALTGQACYRDRVSAQQNIEIRFNTAVTAILGESTVTGLRTRSAGNGASCDLEVAAVFAYVGLQPNTDFVKNRIRLDPAGRIPTDGCMRTELPGICAAGTVRSHSPHRAASAAGDGASAAVALDRYLADGAWPLAIALVQGSTDEIGRYTWISS